MKQVLKELRYNYLMEECGKIDTKKEKHATALLAEADERLLATLNEEQKVLFGRAQNCLDEVYAFSIERAFEKGLFFSFEYLLALLRRE